MPRHTLAALVAAALLAACGDPGARPLTAPAAPAAAPSRTIAPGTACTKADFDALNASTTTVYGAAVLQDARQLLGKVRAKCPAKDAVLDLVQQTVDWRRADPTLVPASDADTWAFLTGLFDYIGYGLDNGPLALGDEGFIRVCSTGADCEAIAPRQTSGVKIFRGALGGLATNRFLVTGAPVPCRGTDQDPSIDERTDLQIFGQCIEVSVDPKPGVSFPLQPASNGGPRAIVQTCVSEAGNQLGHYLFHETPDLGDTPTGVALPTRARLAQRSRNAPRVQLRPRPVSTFFTGNCDAVTLFARGVDAPASRLQQLLGRPTMLALGRAAATIFLPRIAQAGHGGLGSLPGLIDDFSKFGPADPYAFQATFDNPYPSAEVPNITRDPDVVGNVPVDDDLGRAKWTYDAEPPGYVRVVAAGFGGLTTGQAVQINQAGGAAAGKRGVTLLANLAHFDQSTEERGSLADAGRYRIRWTSVITTPRAGGEGSFIVRAQRTTATGTTTVDVVKFGYTNAQSAQRGPITFTGETGGTGTTTLTWAQNVPQRFEILVDLGLVPGAAGTATLRTLDANGVPSAVIATASFAANANLAQAGWALRGQDNQIIGMDNFEIVRLPDR